LIKTFLYINIENLTKIKEKIESNNVKYTELNTKLNMCTEKIKSEDLVNKQIEEKINNFLKNEITTYIYEYNLYIKRQISKFNDTEYLLDEAQQIKKHIQLYTKLCQLEFNCTIRRKEGYMINTTLKKMQEFISGLLYKSAIKIFEQKQVRTHWDEKQEKWYFAIVDVIAILTESNNPQVYWRVLKKRLLTEGNETVTNCNGLKMQAPDGKMRLTDVADTEQLFRLIQSIPSPKAEPFKLWLAKVANDRLDEMQDPEISIDRALAILALRSSKPISPPLIRLVIVS
jgi:hypothetical protein